jgi:glycosyltransferase involved in cell wall biosynthesis
VQPVRTVYIISGIEKALAFEWICGALDKRKIELHFIVLGRPDTPLRSFITSKGLPYYPVPLAGKAGLIKAWITVFSILRTLKPAVVHTHLYYASLIGLSAAWLLRIRKRIHTRHHASLHHRYFPRAVYLDKLVNAISSHIIVLCNNQSKIVVDWEGAPLRKVQLIPHGFDLSYFETEVRDKVHSLHTTYGIPDGAFPVVGVIARYTEWKGVHFIIPAFKSLVTRYPGAHLILCNAQGDYAGPIQAMLKELPPGRYTEIRFEPDLASLYKLFDLFVHTPIDEFAEAFGQTYVEALASGVPSIFTLSGIACDFIEHRKNAWVVPYKNTDEIALALTALLQDSALRTSLIQTGRRSVAERFGIREMIEKLESLYTA